MTNIMTLHSRLRQETRILHEDLERAVQIDEQISTRGRYAAYLVRLWALYAAAEKSLRPIDFSPLGFDYSDRRRSELIESDLRTLGIDPLTLDRGMNLEAPLNRTIESGLGCVYVLEGSALGARAMAPTVEARLGLTKTHGAEFFWGYGEGGKLLWRTFLASVNAIDPFSVRAEQVVESAKATFLFFQRWLPECREKITSSAVA
ncbi:MAG: biliverdin-producing heme oxygenase [Proteobacteria bacterium]|nr:biliverdin-producing heme oxygenase [Pseudomonadota bacterium]